MSKVLPNNALVRLVSVLTFLLLPSLFPVCNTASLPKRPPSKARSKSLRDMFSGHALNRTRRGASWPGVVLRYKTPQHKLYMKILYPAKLKSSTEVHKKTPVYITRGNMYCRTGYYLRINSDGTVDGTTHFTSTHVNLEFHSIETSLLMIRDLKTSRYLSITDNGILVGNIQPSLNSVFVETHEKNQFTTYSSYKFRHRNWFVAIKRNGKAKRAQATGIGQRSTQFLVRFSRV